MKGLAKNCEGAFVGLAQTVYLTVYIYTVLLQGFSEIYGVYIRFQPTLGIWHLRWCMMLWVWQFGSVTGEVLVSELKLHKWSRDKLLVSELKLHKWPRDKLLHT